MELTKDEAVRLHRVLWGWLAENPRANKEHWIGWQSCGGDVKHAFGHCFCCEYDSQFKPDDCTSCPIDWPGDDCLRDGDSEGLFALWELALIDRNFKNTAKYAAQIRDLPERLEDTP